jgi:hypothetical protein
MQKGKKEQAMSQTWLNRRAELIAKASNYIYTSQ